jgi:hypothetical protein
MLTVKHGLGLLRILLKGEVVIDGEVVRHAFYVEVVGADEGECSMMLLQFTDEIMNHPECEFLS